MIGNANRAYCYGYDTGQESFSSYRWMTEKEAETKNIQLRLNGDKKRWVMVQEDLDR